MGRAERWSFRAKDTRRISSPSTSLSIPNVLTLTYRWLTWCWWTTGHRSNIRPTRISSRKSMKFCERTSDLRFNVKSRYKYRHCRFKKKKKKTREKNPPERKKEREKSKKKKKKIT